MYAITPIRLEVSCTGKCLPTRAVQGGYVQVGYVQVGYVKVGYVKVGYVQVGYVKVGYVQVGYVQVGYVQVGYVLLIYALWPQFKHRACNRAVENLQGLNSHFGLKGQWLPGMFWHETQALNPPPPPQGLDLKIWAIWSTTHQNGALFSIRADIYSVARLEAKPPCGIKSFAYI